MKKQDAVNQIIMYETPDGKQRVNVRFEDETAWLTQKRIAELFDVETHTINYHIKEIFKSKELQEDSVIRNFRITAADGKSYDTLFYNLDMIISVGYRVNSSRATQFRIWATQRLREYIIKGFTLDDERLKQGGGRARYFEELLQRVRDIRSSERLFYQKVADIYATSIDYRKDDALTKKFFATVQNKMHYAVHGHTAAEIISQRANSAKPLMGLTNFPGSYLTAHDICIAKNYLTERELKTLNLIVDAYLSFAEIQATDERPMKMQDWIKKLDDFLKLSEKKLLTHAGAVSAERALATAKKEFEKYKRDQDKNLISDFDKATKKYLKKS